MIATHSFRILQKLINFAHCISLLPFRYDSLANRFVTKPAILRFRSLKFQLWRLILGTSILFQALHVASYVGVCTMANVSVVEKCTLCCITCIWAVTAMVQHFYITESQAIVKYFNNVFIANENFRELL